MELVIRTEMTHNAWNHSFLSEKQFIKAFVFGKTGYHLCDDFSDLNECPSSQRLDKSCKKRYIYKNETKNGYCKPNTVLHKG